MFCKIVQYLKLIFVNCLLQIAACFIHRNPKYAAIGSWCGERYADNSKYLARYLCENRKDITVFWVGSPDIRKEVIEDLPGVKFLVINSVSSLLVLLRCQNMFFSQMHSADISKYNVYRGAKLCLLHHGTAIKKWGQDGLNQRVGKYDNWIEKWKLKISGELQHYDYFVTSSPEEDKTHLTALAYRGCIPDRLLKTGTPRNDLFFCADKEFISERKRYYSRLLGFRQSDKIMLYLPTFRRTKAAAFSFMHLKDDKQKEILELLDRHCCTLIEKSHVVSRNNQATDMQTERVICADKNLDVQELMLISDVLISDYSSAFLDYSILDRPVIHMVYDYQYYRDKDSGLYYDIDTFAAGEVADDIAGLIEAIRNSLHGNDQYRIRRKKVCERFMAYETGNASEKIIKAVIGEQKN